MICRDDVVTMSQRTFSYPAPSLKEVVLNDRSVTTRAIGFEGDSFNGPNDTKKCGRPIAR